MRFGARFKLVKGKEARFLRPVTIFDKVPINKNLYDIDPFKDLLRKKVQNINIFKDRYV